MLEELMDDARAGGSPAGLERIIVKGLLREYHGRDDDLRQILVGKEPRLTGTVWDAVVAATVEHACTTHGRSVPAWTQGTRRFLTRPWTACKLDISRGTALANSPAAFIRHNVFIDARSLDERSGDRHVWATDERTTTGALRPPEREAASA